MNSDKVKSIVSIGFIDLLTGFLCSTAALMIIIRYGAEQTGDIAGGPKDYIYYKCAVEFLDPADDQYGIENSLIQLLIKKPGDQWVESEIDQNGMVINNDGFVSFNDDSYYGLGPAIKLVEKQNKLYFHIYGFGIILISN